MSRKITTALKAAATLTLLSALPAAADTPALNTATEPGAEQHDGFFLRMITGPGGLGAAVATEGQDDISFGGGGEMFELSIGAAVTENLILHADFLGAGTRSLDGQTERDVELNLGDHELTMGGLGGGVTYYWMPHNVYLSGSVMAMAAELTDKTGAKDRAALSVDYGALARLVVGKEWWVSDNWGLGVALSVYGGVGVGEDDQGRDIDAGVGGGALAFTATFN